jgi:hypothetical protein
MRWVLAAVVVLAVAGCGGSAKLAVSRDGRAVLQDAYDGRLDRHWSCGSLRAAYRRLPPDPPAYSAIPALIGGAAGSACDTALASVRLGMRKAGVVGALGAPDRAPRCWLYRWPPDRASATDGARICFAAGTVARIQRAVHG